MEQNEIKKTKIVIAAKQFLYRLGVKTIISVIGIEPDIYETNNFENTKKCLRYNPDTDFMVINQDLLPTSENAYLNELEKLCPCGKLMVIGDEQIKNCPCTCFMHNVETQREVLERFQEFFFEPNQNTDKEENKTLLSERETEVLKEVAYGYSNKEIADKLFISTNTVITHRKNITDKLGIKTIAGLTVYAIMNNIINPVEVSLANR